MAKYECIIPKEYDFDETLKYFHDHISSGSMTASFEDGSDYRVGNLRVAVRVYERYSLMGGNRVSMNLMLIGSDQEIFVSAITAAGGGGVAKFIGWGEDEFLGCFIEAAMMFEGMTPVKTFDRRTNP